MLIVTAMKCTARLQAPAIASLTLAGLLAASSGAAGTNGATAPAAPQAHEGGRVERVIDISPRIGPPGTRVTLEVARMPAMTPVQVAIGATRTGFEALTLSITTMDGDLVQTVAVPEWSREDATHRFIMFNLYFSTILAQSAIFHVTDAQGRVVRSGTITRPEPACLILEGDDGELYRLTGATDDLEVGNETQLRGTLSEAAQGCGLGVSLDLDLGSSP